MTATTDEEFRKRLFPHSFVSRLRYEHLVAGLTGGVVSTLVTHPFDLIKLRFAGIMENDAISWRQIPVNLSAN